MADAQGTMYELEVKSSAPLMGADGPEGIILDTDLGWHVLRGPAAVALLATPGPSLKRSRTPRAPGPAAGSAIKEGTAAPKAGVKCWQCKKCPSQFTQKGNARMHIRNVHKIKISPEKHIKPC